MHIDLSLCSCSALLIKTKSQFSSLNSRYKQFSEPPRLTEHSCLWISALKWPDTGILGGRSQTWAFAMGRTSLRVLRIVWCLVIQDFFHNWGSYRGYFSRTPLHTTHLHEGTEWSLRFPYPDKSVWSRFSCTPEKKQRGGGNRVFWSKSYGIQTDTHTSGTWLSLIFHRKPR